MAVLAERREAGTRLAWHDISRLDELYHRTNEQSYHVHIHFSEQLGYGTWKPTRTKCQAAISSILMTHGRNHTSMRDRLLDQVHRNLLSTPSRRSPLQKWKKVRSDTSSTRASQQAVDGPAAAAVTNPAHEAKMPVLESTPLPQKQPKAGEAIKPATQVGKDLD